MEEKQEKMIDIWFFVGLILTVYGVILTIVGIYFLFKPYEKVVLNHLNTNLWWGGIMSLAGILFLVGSLRARKLDAGGSEGSTVT